jgi:WD40 repeat protein
VVAAHDADITCCEFNYSLGIVATGSRDTNLKLWDFQDMRLECLCQGHTAGTGVLLCTVVCFAASIRGHSVVLEVTSVVMFGLRPVFASCDAAGTIIFWSSRGLGYPGRMLYKYTHSKQVQRAAARPNRLSKRSLSSKNIVVESTGDAYLCGCFSRRWAWLTL